MRLIDADVLKRRAITVRFFGEDIMMVPTSEIDDAPTIEAEQGWIPCSERLPQIGTTVITCDGDGSIHLDYIIKVADSSLGFCQNIAYGDCGIIAWMPLPTPYKGGDDE